MATTINVASVRDTYVAQAAPNQNFGDAAKLSLNGSGSVGRYVFFGMPFSLPASTVMVTATLRVRLQGSWTGGPHTVTAKRVTGEWQQNLVTWNNKPAVTATNAASGAVTGGVDGDTLDIVCTAMVEDVIASGTYRGFRLELDTATNLPLYSAESVNPSYRPRLIIEYSLPSDEPTSLYPDDGVGMGVASPVLQWAPDSGDVQSQSKVVIATSEANLDAGTYVYDSGYQVNTESNWDLTGQYTTTTGNTYWWKVRVKNESGAISDWSANASFAYWTQGALSITAPAADNDDVENPTPTITHALTVRTQAFVKHELYVYDAASASYVLLYTSPREASTALSWVPPAGYIKTASGKYKVTVYVWDDKTRPQSVYTSVSRIFDWVTAGTVTAPASLAAVVTAPRVALTWTRATAPDAWQVLVDGVIVKQEDDAASWFVSGTTYAYDWYGAISGETYSITVRAYTEGVGSSNASNAVEVTATFAGIWLVETGQLITVSLLGQSRVDTDLSSDGETFHPVDRRDPVRIVGVVRGYEGTASGVLTTDVSGSPTTATYRSRLESIFGQYSLSPDLRLIAGNRNMPVVVGNLSMSEWPAAEETYDVSFDWWQVGEFTVPTDA